jgi:hypothetical protein
MSIDELFFHRTRPLPRWEIIGHPIDTLSVTICYAWTWLATPTPYSVWVFVGLCAFSCACITKDEFIHTTHCSVGEHWLHAALFVLHPVALGIAALLWSAQGPDVLTPALAHWSGLALPEPGPARTLLAAQSVLVALFTSYQIVYSTILYAAARRA